MHVYVRGVHGLEDLLGVGFRPCTHAQRASAAVFVHPLIITHVRGHKLNDTRCNVASLMTLTPKRASDRSGASTFLPAIVPTSSRASPRACTPTHALPLSMATARDQPEMGSGAARGGGADPGSRRARQRYLCNVTKGDPGPRRAATPPLYPSAPAPQGPTKSPQGQFLPSGQFLPRTSKLTQTGSMSDGKAQGARRSGGLSPRQLQIEQMEAGSTTACTSPRTRWRSSRARCRSGPSFLASFEARVCVSLLCVSLRRCVFASACRASACLRLRVCVCVSLFCASACLSANGDSPAPVPVWERIRRVSLRPCCQLLAVRAAPAAAVRSTKMLLL